MPQTSPVPCNVCPGGQQQLAQKKHKKHKKSSKHSSVYSDASSSSSWSRRCDSSSRSSSSCNPCNSSSSCNPCNPCPGPSPCPGPNPIPNPCPGPSPCPGPNPNPCPGPSPCNPCNGASGYYPQPLNPCNKCYSRKCHCIEYYPCLRKKCGIISATLTKSANPSYFLNVGDQIIYSYTITNTGTADIRYPISINDSFLGGWQIPCVWILPCQSQTFSRTYTVTAADVARKSIVNTAVAYIQVCSKKWVCTQAATVTVTYGSADLYGALGASQPSFEAVSSKVDVPAQAEPVPVPVYAQGTIVNNSTSATAAKNVKLNLNLPPGVSSVTNPIISTGTITQSGTGPIQIAIPSIDIGATVTYTFTFTVPAPTTTASYTWSGTITSDTFDPNPANNFVTHTFTVSD